MSAILTDRDGATAAAIDMLTVADFLTVPPDRIDACLADFRRFLEWASALQSWGHPASRFLWLDDGQGFLYTRAPPTDDLPALARQLYGIEPR